MFSSSEAFAQALHVGDWLEFGVEYRIELLALECEGHGEAGFSEVSPDLFTKTCTGSELSCIRK